MKTKITLPFIILFVIAVACSRKQDTPEPYSDYISIQLAYLPPTDLVIRNSVQIYIKNDSGKDLENECLVTYSFKDSISGITYTSENLLFNKMIPERPNGVFNLKGYQSQIITTDLKDLTFKDIIYDNLPASQYICTVQLFIKDPYSPMNVIRSNTVTFEKTN
jgi:hypothetical protein